MTSRKRVLGAVFTLLSLPPLVALFEAVSFHVRNRSNGSIVSSGAEREYLLYVPKSYDSTRPTALVLSLHGGAGWPAIQRDVSGWNRLAESHAFLVVYPAGLGSEGLKAWRVWEGEGVEEDVRFISDLIDELQKTYNVDPARIYANGLSNGGAMAFVLSCTLSDRIAAVGMVGAAQTLPWTWCQDSRPVPMISFHGTADPIVPYEGGTSWVVPHRPLPHVLEWTANWADRNRCRPEPALSAVAADVTRLEYADCALDASVVLLTIDGGGHTWPGGMPLPEWFVGPTSESVDATREMWAFFEEHRLARRSYEISPAAEPAPAEELLAKSISYHDPESVWRQGAFRLALTTRRADGTEAEKQVLLAPGHGRYELREVRDGLVIEQKLYDGRCTFAIDGATDVSDAQRKEHGLTCERLTLWRNYHTYLWGLPMKLRDPGTIVDPEVRRTSFQDRPVDALRITYEPEVGTDVWYVFLDPESHAMVGYEFYKDEKNRVGEYIVLEDEAAGGGLRLPKSRAWYRTQNDEYLGTDVLTSLTREEF